MLEKLKKYNMTKQMLISKTINNLSKLPENRIKEISEYAEFLLRNIDEKITTEGIQKLVSDSKSFEFLKEEEDLYTRDDLKEVYK